MQTLPKCTTTYYVKADPVLPMLLLLLVLYWVV
jgi:hypothetical protein